MSEESSAVPADQPPAAAAVEATAISLKRPPRTRPAKINPPTGAEPAESASGVPAEPGLRLATPSLDAAPGGEARLPAPAPAPFEAAVLPAPSRLSTLLASLQNVLNPPTLARYGAYAGAVTIALAAGWAGAHFLNATSRNASASVAFAAQTDARLEKLAEDMRMLRESVAGLVKPARVRGADDLKPVNDRVAALTDAVEKFRAEQSGRIGALAAAIERAEKADRENSARVAQIAERLDRGERPAPATTGSIPGAPAPAAAASPPNPPQRPNVTAVEQKPPSKQIEGWTLREIYDGMALIESRRAGLVEVQPGQTVRGLGRIERIERRSGRWVVVTDQGVIAAN